MIVVWAFLALNCACALLFAAAWLVYVAWAPALLAAVAAFGCWWCVRQIDRR